jgi:predicted nucleic acid-binding Zn ribbon protein
MLSPKLNDLTLDDAAALRELMKKDIKVCVWCEKKIEMKSHQKFCSDKCRYTYHNARMKQATIAKRAAKDNSI